MCAKITNTYDTLFYTYNGTYIYRYYCIYVINITYRMRPIDLQRNCIAEQMRNFYFYCAISATPRRIAWLFFLWAKNEFSAFKVWCEAVACVWVSICVREKQSKWGVRINNYHFFFFFFNYHWAHGGIFLREWDHTEVGRTMKRSQCGRLCVHIIFFFF